MRTTERSVDELLQCHLRAAELEIRAGGEPFRSGLEVARSKAQVLWRIEELVAELVPAMESRGYEIVGRRQ